MIFKKWVESLQDMESVQYGIYQVFEIWAKSGENA